LDQDLQELINNEKENGEDENAFSKFMSDMKQDDKEAFKNAYKIT